MSNIFSLIPKIMGEVGAIEKTRTNAKQGYRFRGIDDFFLALQDPLSKHGVFFCTNVLEHKREERASQSGGVLTYTILNVEFTAYAPDGSSIKVTTIGEAMDSGDKSANKAMSVAMKYALMQLFCIPTEDDKDPESHNPDPAPKTQTKILEPHFKQRPQPPARSAVDAWAPSEAQLKRMFAISRQHDWTDAQVKEALMQHYKIDSSKKLTRQQYDDFCNTILPSISAQPRELDVDMPEQPAWLNEDGYVK
jgi:hypothetical protein